MHFQIESTEGLLIRGEIASPARPRALAVVVHGFKGFKDWGFFPWLSERLCEAGFAAVRFNMSRSGIENDPESFDRLDLFADDTYSAQISDLVTVVRHSQGQLGRLPLFLLGHSRGGGVALLAARELEQLHGIVTWSAISHVDRWDAPTKTKWRADGFMDVVNARTKQVMRMSPRILDDYEANRDRFDILASAARLRVPLLVVHGGSDESVPAGEAHQIAGRAKDSSLLIIGGASHTYNAIHPLVHVPPALDYAAVVSEHFLAAYS